MKRIIILIMAALILLTGCGTGTAENEQTTPELPKTQEEPESEFEADESIPNTDEERVDEAQETTTDYFKEALLSKQKHENIPDEYDYYNKLIGAWDIEYIYHNGNTENGQWYFSWVIEGMAVQDVIVLPSLYATSIRLYKNKSWNVSWIGNQTVINYLASKSDSNGAIVHTNLSDGDDMQIFVEINEDTFHWQLVKINDDDTGYVEADIYAVRKTPEPGENFYDVLISGQKSDIIPDEHNYYEKLIGHWKTSGSASGEWHFNWILDGTVIQDIFIAYGYEYGIGTRYYNQADGTWYVSYFATGAVHLDLEVEDDMLIHTRRDNTKEKWVFVEINDDSFTWRNIRVDSDETWNTNSIFRGKPME